MKDTRLDQPAFTLTVGELLQLIRSEMTNKNSVVNKKESDNVKYLHSIKELADFLGCSTTTANKIKKSGKIRFNQCGRKVLFNVAHILEDIDQSIKG